MNYGQIKSELAGLGFSDEAEITEFAEIVPDSLNRAITEINMTISPIIGVYEFVQSGDEEGVLHYNLTELTAEEGEVKFIDFADTPVMIEPNSNLSDDTGQKTSIYRKFNDFEIENQDTIVIDGSIEGKFRVFYKKAHTPFTVDTDDLTEIELPLRVHHLVPLLTAYYVWLEDEKSKAVDYYNQYEKLSQAILSTVKRPRMTILSGGI